LVGEPALEQPAVKDEAANVGFRATTQPGRAMTGSAGQAMRFLDKLFQFVIIGPRRVIMNKAHDCCFCAEFEKGEVDETLFLRYGIKNRILYSNDHFVVLPTASPLVDGHFLVLPRWHINTLKQLHASEKQELFGVVQNLISSCADSYFIFEHGAFPVNGNTCGVDHAHLHILPLGNAVSLQVMEKVKGEYAPEFLGDLLGALSYRKEMPYLLYGNDIKAMYNSVDGNFPSQFIRKKICEVLNNPDWDWKLLTNRDSFVESMAYREKIIA
jgi:diadenosine tetraphosphate (Ap4A) HIT family hydrolase